LLEKFVTFDIFSGTFLHLRRLVPIFYCNLWLVGVRPKNCYSRLQKKKQLSALPNNRTLSTPPNKYLSQSSTHVTPFFLKNINTMAASATATAGAHTPPPSRPGVSNPRSSVRATEASSLRRCGRNGGHAPEPPLPPRHCPLVVPSASR